MITILGAEWCPACTRIRSKVEELGATYNYIEIPSGDEGWDLVESLTGKRTIPQLFFYIGGTSDFNVVMDELTKERDKA